MHFSLLSSFSPDLAMLVLALAVPLALGIDWYLGEPSVRWHPVVWMGRYLGWVGQWLAPLVRADSPVPAGHPDWVRLVLGALAWLAGAAAVCQASWLLQIGLMVLPDALGQMLGSALAVLLMALALKPMLAWRMLRDEVLAVEGALAQSLAAGRERLRWLVSRDVALLDEAGVRESAIESLAENLNDSVVAPIFWFVLLGLPGAAVYRFANTADAMWGYRGRYKGRNWEWAGKWAARADDVLSWVPARITALLLMLVALVHRLGLRGGGSSGVRLPGYGWRVLQREAGRTPSPNSGWPMAAMALGLQVCLNKPQVYTLNARGKSPQAADTLHAIAYSSHVVLLVAVIATIAILLLAKVPTP